MSGMSEITTPATVLLDSTLRTLAATRPIFHSEADLQHALAWTIATTHPQAHVRLETRPAPGVHLDLFVADPLAGHRHAIEIKYPTAAWTGTVPGDNSGPLEEFNLRAHGAQDLTGYDCVKDLVRLERCTHTGYATTGTLVVLTNDASLWRAPQHGRATNAAAFRLHEGTVLAGARTWGPNTGGTSRGREAALDLHGTYTCRWTDYATLPGPRGQFRSLILPIN